MRFPKNNTIHHHKPYKIVWAVVLLCLPVAHHVVMKRQRQMTMMMMSPGYHPATALAATTVAEAQPASTLQLQQSYNHTAHIQTLLTQIEPAYRPMCRAILEGQPVCFSQAWQDWILYHNYLVLTTTTTTTSGPLAYGDGVYWDLSGHDPTFGSTTLFFDKCLGWRGICAASEYHKQIQQERGCQLVPHCVQGATPNNRVEGTVGRGNSSAVAATSSSSSSNNNMTKCVGVQQLQQQYQFDRIDLVHLNGEATSLLQSWPFDKIQPTMFLVDARQQQDWRVVDFFFHRHNYVGAETFVHNAPPASMSNTLDSGWGKLYVRTGTPMPTTKRYPPKMPGPCPLHVKRYRGQWCRDFVRSLPWNRTTTME